MLPRRWKQGELQCQITATVGLRCWGEDTYHFGLLMCSSGTLAFATPGVFGGTSINGEKYWGTTAQTLSGSLLGTLPLLLSPGEMQMFVARGPSGCVFGDYFACLVYGSEAAVASVLAGLGVGMDLGLMGSGATIGYQWAGGGPRR